MAALSAAFGRAYIILCISPFHTEGNTVVIVPEMDRPYFAILLSIVRGDTLNSWAMMGTWKPWSIR